MSLPGFSEFEGCRQVLTFFGNRAVSKVLEFPTDTCSQQDMLVADNSSIFDEPVTLWIERLREEQDSDAAQQLWNRYASQLATVAKKRFGDLSRRVYDEEDAAISAFRSFCNGVAKQQFSELNDRDNLWAILVTITSRKVIARQRREHRQRRGGGEVWEQPLYSGPGDDNEFPEPAGPEPTPEFVAEVADECEALLNRLEDETLRDVTLLKLEGYTNEEIAEKLGYTRRSIQRKLARIRQQLSEDVE